MKNQARHWSHPPTARLRTLAAALCCAGLLGACSVAPSYQVPSTPAPAAFKEAGALWQTAQPNDAIERGEWWQLFGDAQLNHLAAQVQINNQNIAAAAAAVTASGAPGVVSEVERWARGGAVWGRHDTVGSSSAGKDQATVGSSSVGGGDADVAASAVAVAPGSGERAKE